MPKVTVTSAVKLSSTQLKTIQDAFTKKFTSVDLETVIDPQIIGGVKVTIGSKQIDASVQGKLNQLKQALQ